MTRTLRITVGVDAEAPSRLAVDWAIHQAITRPVAITLLTSFDMIIDAPLAEEAQLALERERILAAAPGTEVETLVAEGSIPEILSRYADASDVLVIGSHRTRHYRSVLSGDLPARVAQHAHGPVVVVPDDWSPRDGAVVVGLEDDGSSAAALERAAQFALDAGRELRILHAWMRPDPPSDPVSLYLRVPADLHDEHRAHLADAARAVRAAHPGLAVVEELYEGSTSNGLIAVAASAELVVIGSHRRGALAGFLQGSVGRELLHYCTTPVCIVPSPPDGSPVVPTEPDEAFA
jgi:nucleotide-binding universal stress UspA family protein